MVSSYLLNHLSKCLQDWSLQWCPQAVPFNSRKSAHAVCKATSLRSLRLEPKFPQTSKNVCLNLPLPILNSKSIFMWFIFLYYFPLLVLATICSPKMLLVEEKILFVNIWVTMDPKWKGVGMGFKCFCSLSARWLIHHANFLSLSPIWIQTLLCKLFSAQSLEASPVMVKLSALFVVLFPGFMQEECRAILWKSWN